ncbi:MAG: sporulation protein YtfJ [Clostridia bacterium]|nr:sporulation protein YtfJ [Clostridia bacterium]
MANENKIEEIIRTSLENMRSMVDANTVIGDPYVTPNGVTVIPVSKISVGFASGGVDYFGKQEKPANQQNFGGGGGSGLSVIPVGFLVIGADGRVDMINIGEPAGSDPVGQIADIIERSPEIIENIVGIFKKKGEKKSDAQKAMEE